ncbi:MAG: protein kinase, partial [Gammaproteobacteria bacterium]|nr:protein kinase [Gammaproteobacteria bacterium]
SNVFITDTQEIKLLDFGLARYADDAGDDTDGRLSWATPTYASPDVLSGSTPTIADDIFSLACLAYRLLSGTHPFAGSTSLEAEQAGISAPRVPGLSDERWQILSRALSYTKSDRPNSASAFLADHTTSASLDEDIPSTYRDEHLTETNFGTADLFPLRRLTDWLPAITAVAVTLFAGLFWLSQTDYGSGVTDATETALLSPEVQRLLNSAAQAIGEQRFITPDELNARDMYREVLLLEPSNSAALDGLRAISDHYVQQAISALRANAPADAAAGLAIAQDIDPLNPAFTTARELLVAHGDGQLANAQLAAARGDVARADEFLSSAERYAHIDADAISAVRLQLEERAENQDFLNQLATADAHITAGRLTAPDGTNARALLIELKRNHANDSRLMSSMERLGQRLLTRATLAVDAARFTEAAGWLDAADSLGVLSVEVAAARSSLLRT